MAKNDLNLLAYGAGEILTRNELKKIVGGAEGSASGSSKICTADDCKTANNGLGCRVGESCTWSSNLSICACKANLA